MDWASWLPILLRSTADTLYMVLVSTAFTVLLGLPLGILLVVTQPRGLAARPALHKVLDLLVNITRSFPFIILLVIVIPLTRALVGTTIGATAAIVPLSLAAIPFFARVAETGFREVDRGLLEAAQSMGATVGQTIAKVLIPEALPSLVLGVSLTIISLVSYSAMAGAIGGGGLGDLAIRYGYQRFQTEIMVVTVALLVVLVQGVQGLGNWLAARLTHR